MHNRFEPESTHEAAPPSLERYLDLLCAPLERDLSPQECESTRQELRSHLLLSAAAHEGTGMGSEEALTAAVMQRYHVNTNVKRELGSKLGKLQTV